MGCGQSELDKILDEPDEEDETITISKPSDYKKEPTKSAYSNRDRFIPLFTTKTTTVIYGYTRYSNSKMFPTDLIDIIYKYMKNNCAFIIIFENKLQQHSYLHEMDVESGTNQNLSDKYKHGKNHIWNRIPGASYCYGEYNNDENAIYRFGGKEQKNIVCTLKNGNVFILPSMGCERVYAQSIYSRNHGIYVIGGNSNIGHDATKTTLKYNDQLEAWINIGDMMQQRNQHLSLFYESHHLNISDKIFSLGGCISRYIYDADYHEGTDTVEYYDFNTQKWEWIANMNRKRRYLGGCIDIETDKIVVIGGYKLAAKRVEEYDFTKDEWYWIGDFTNFSHEYYPQVTKHNQVVVVFGNNGYIEGQKDYGYVEYLDQRDYNKKWTVLSSLREMLEFKGIQLIIQVKNSFFQHMLQM